MNSPIKSTWQIDQDHSYIQFSVKHLGIASISGAFTAFAGTVQTERDDFAGAQVQLEIAAASLSTNNELRDGHLKSDVFFDVQRFPKLTFSGVLQKLTEGDVLTGTLTIGEISKQVALQTAFTGTGKGRGGDTRAGFEVVGSLNRTDFGLTWNMLTEIGSLAIGETIKLQMGIELIKEEVAVAGEAAN